LGQASEGDRKCLATTWTATSHGVAGKYQTSKIYDSEKQFALEMFSHMEEDETQFYNQCFSDES
jgi:hypothetical protein